MLPETSFYSKKRWKAIQGGSSAFARRTLQFEEGVQCHSSCGKEKLNKDKALLDKVSAALILQDYLNERENS